jgi:MerR family transcriptional regulator, redox-sensitive transcriptional activator SoxR
MSALSIGEVARRAGVRPSAIRYYEKVGLLTPPPREHGQRRYAPSVLHALMVIRYAKRAGFTIAETKHLIGGFAPDVPASARWRVLALRKEGELAVLIARARRTRALLRAALRCRCRDLDECGRRLDALSSTGASRA